MPPLYRNYFELIEINRPIVSIFLECSEIAHTSKSRFANSCARAACLGES